MKTGTGRTKYGHKREGNTGLTTAAFAVQKKKKQGHYLYVAFTFTKIAV